MNPLQQRIEKAIRGNKKVTPVDAFEEVTFWLAKDLSISPLEILDMPIPLVLSFNEKLRDYYKEKTKAMKKK